MHTQLNVFKKITQIGLNKMCTDSFTADKALFSHSKVCSLIHS